MFNYKLKRAYRDVELFIPAVLAAAAGFVVAELGLRNLFCYATQGEAHQQRNAFVRSFPHYGRTWHLSGGRGACCSCARRDNAQFTHY